MDSVSKLTRFSDTDTKLLIVLCNEMTADDACISCGVSYPYGIKRIGYLHKHGWLTRRQDGKQYYYSTRLSEDTEHFYAVAQNATSTGKVLRIPNFYGQNPTVGEAISDCAKRNIKISGRLNGWSLTEYMGRMIATIKVRSWRKAQGMDNQLPDEQRLREVLEIYINQTERSLRLAKELLESKKLWDGSPTTWKWISEGEPTEQALKFYDEMGRTV